MQLITERSLIRGIVTDVEAMYAGRDRVEVLHKLKELDLGTATIEQLNEIIGNGWITIKCDECGEQVKSAAIFGDAFWYDNNTVTICSDCLRKAIKLIYKRGE